MNQHWPALWFALSDDLNGWFAARDVLLSAKILVRPWRECYFLRNCLKHEHVLCTEPNKQATVYLRLCLTMDYGLIQVCLCPMKTGLLTIYWSAFKRGILAELPMSESSGSLCFSWSAQVSKVSISHMKVHEEMT